MSIAEALRLEAEAAVLTARADALTAAATKAAHQAGPLDPRASLLTCAEARPLIERAAELRRDAADIRAETQPPRSAAPAPKPSARPAPALPERPTVTTAPPPPNPAAEAERLAAAISTFMPTDRVAEPIVEKAPTGVEDKLVAGIASYMPIRRPER